MKEYDAKYLQAINLQNEFQCFKIDYSHLLDDDEKKFLEYKINKLNREQEKYKDYANDLTKMFNKSCELSRKYNKLLNIDDEEDDDDNTSDTASNNNTEAPSDELKEPTEFTDMDEVFKNYIN